MIVSDRTVVNAAAFVPVPVIIINRMPAMHLCPLPGAEGGEIADCVGEYTVCNRMSNGVLKATDQDNKALSHGTTDRPLFHLSSRGRYVHR